MQKQLPVSFTLVTDPEYSEKPDERLVMVSMETSRSGKMVIRARGYWDGDLHTVVKNVPLTDEFDSTLMSNSDYSMASCHYFWDWMRYGAALAILDIALEEWIDYDDASYFKEMLNPPVFQPGKYVQPDYFGKLEKLAESVKLKFIDNGFSSVTMKYS